jgi:hypothetical protein
MIGNLGRPPSGNWKRYFVLSVATLPSELIPDKPRSQPSPADAAPPDNEHQSDTKHCGVTQDVMTPGINERCVPVESGVASSSSLNVRDRFGDLPF